MMVNLDGTKSGTMSEDYYAVVMAGGGGTRLWPLSRKERPKQVLKLLDESSLFQISLQRLEGLFPPERILVVTVREQAELLMEQAPSIPKDNFLIEPCPRGTASVVGLAAIALQNIQPMAVMAVLTADHFMEDEQRFRQLLQIAYLTAQRGYLVTLGIPPTFPATGYGYIQRGEVIEEILEEPVFRVLRFKEKPDVEEAKRLFESSDHSWNSGMFIWQAQRILSEIERHMPHLWKGLLEIRDHWNTSSHEETIAKVWETLEPQTIDYGIMEHAQDVVVIPASGLGWSDVGSWDALFEILPKDADGNILRTSNLIQMSTTQSLVYQEGIERLIVTIGLQDCIIVDTPQALLVCHKNMAQWVKRVVDQLKNENPDLI